MICRTSGSPISTESSCPRARSSCRSGTGAGSSATARSMSTRTFKGRVFKLEEHVERLYRSLKVLRIDPGLSPSEMIDVSAAGDRAQRAPAWSRRRLLGGATDLARRAAGRRRPLGPLRAERHRRMHAAAAQGASAPVPRRHRRGRAVRAPRPAGFADASRQDAQLPEPDHGGSRGARPAIPMPGRFCSMSTATCARASAPTSSWSGTAGS